jgi:hypothetical protein
MLRMAAHLAARFFNVFYPGRRSKIRLLRATDMSLRWSLGLAASPVNWFWALRNFSIEWRETDWACNILGHTYSHCTVKKLQDTGILTRFWPKHRLGKRYKSLAYTMLRR